MAEEILMRAKFPGTCKSCGGRISEGDQILWERGAGARHEACNSEEPSGDALVVDEGNDDWKDPVWRDHSAMEKITECQKCGSTLSSDDALVIGNESATGFRRVCPRCF